VVKLDFIAPIDIKTIAASAEKTGRVFVLEEAAEGCCVGNRVLSSLSERGVNMRCAKLINLGGKFIPHGNADKLREKFGTNDDAVVRAVMKELADEQEKA